MSVQLYNSTTDELTQVAGEEFNDTVIRVSALPSASADLINETYLLVADQTGYVRGGIYQCQYVNDAFTWVLVNGSGVPVDVVEDGNMNAVTSNAVADKFATLGTASEKDYTPNVQPNNHDLVESNAVYHAINNALSSIYTPRGNLTCAELTSALLISTNVGNVYEMSDSGTTSDLFLQGAGETISVGDNVGIIQVGESTYKFNLMANAFDLTDYQKKDLASAIEGATTVEGALGALSTNKATQAEVNDIVNVLGAKNLLPNKATSQVVNGVTFTVNSDGSVTANGTASGGNAMFVVNHSTIKLKKGTYIFSALTTQGSTSTFDAWTSNWGDGVIYFDRGDGVEFTISSDQSTGYVAVRVYEGQTVSNLTFYPMIRPAFITDDTYQPYAMTNQELTVENQTLTNQVKDMNNVLGSKNLLSQKYMQVLLRGTPVGNKVKSINGLTIVYGKDGSIEINGTPTDSSKPVAIHFDWTTSVYDYNIENLAGKKVIGSITDTAINGIKLLLGCFLSDGTANQSGYIYTNGEYTYPSDAVWGRTWLSISGEYSYNRAKVYPMIRLASITDDTYVPYSKTNRQLTEDSVTWDDLSEVGAVNYLPITATSQTIYGVTYTVNSDDGSITVDGTATGGNASLAVNMTTYLKKGTYKLTGAPEGYENTTRLAITRGTPSGVFDNGNGATFTLTEDATNALYVQAIVWEGKTVDNLTFKPMITVPSYNGDYVPYAKSNKELTEDIDTVNSQISELNASSYIDLSGNYASIRLRRLGNIKMIYINGLKNLTVGTLYTMPGFIPDDYLPIQDIAVSVFSPISDGAHEMYRVTLTNNGDLSIYAYNGVVAQANARTAFTYL